MCRDCNCGLPPAPEPVHRRDQPHSHAQEPGEPAHRLVELSQRLLARNDALADANRQRFREAGLRVINLLSSPGSGKTALLERLALELAGALPMAVLVGDLATDNDARRLREAGLAAIAISTGQICHLEAAMVQRGLAQLADTGVALETLALLVIENVGNLVCPAAYDLGESLRVVLLSVTEGEDKPLKYPALFQTADLVVISKSDLAGPAGFQRDLALANLARVAPRARIVELSARSSKGFGALLEALDLHPTALAG